MSGILIIGDTAEPFPIEKIIGSNQVYLAFITDNKNEEAKLKRALSDQLAGKIISINLPELINSKLNLLEAEIQN